MIRQNLSENPYLCTNMKESHLFYAPDIATSPALSEEEATHAVRVLRLREGDELWLTDGRGMFYDAVASPAGSSRHPECYVTVTATRSWKAPWVTPIHLVVAPTKNLDRIEWMAEKATEVGFDALTFADCANSERRVLKTDRIERIVVSAMKQSHKAIKPSVSPLTRLADIIAAPFAGDRFICHCYDQRDVNPDATAEDKPLLFDVVRRDVPTQVMIGPEGDFSIAEVRAAEAAGFRSVSLGESRLRTETAALMAVAHTNLKKTLCEH